MEYVTLSDYEFDFDKGKCYKNGRATNPAVKIGKNIVSALIAMEADPEVRKQLKFIRPKTCAQIGAKAYTSILHELKPPKIKKRNNQPPLEDIAKQAQEEYRKLQRKPKSKNILKKLVDKPQVEVKLKKLTAKQWHNKFKNIQ
jgi:Mn-containing catalase